MQPGRRISGDQTQVQKSPSYRFGCLTSGFWTSDLGENYVPSSYHLLLLITKHPSYPWTSLRLIVSRHRPEIWPVALSNKFLALNKTEFTQLPRLTMMGRMVHTFNKGFLHNSNDESITRNVGFEVKEVMPYAHRVYELLSATFVSDVYTLFIQPADKKINGVPYAWWLGPGSHPGNVDNLITLVDPFPAQPGGKSRQLERQSQ